MKILETKQLKSYKGYEIHKAWYEDEYTGEKKSDYFYLVADEDDYIGEEYRSLAEAKEFINNL